MELRKVREEMDRVLRVDRTFYRTFVLLTLILLKRLPLIACDALISLMTVLDMLLCHSVYFMMTFS